jgi:transferrin binding protein
MKKSVLAVLLASGILGACGGGGGGGGGGTRPSDTVPASDPTPPAATLDPLGQIPATGNHIDYTLATGLTATELGSSAALNGAATPSVSLSNAPSIRVAIPELNADDTFTAADVSSTLDTFFRINTASHSDGTTTRTVTYVAPDTGDTNPFKLQFSSLGVWNTTDIATGNVTQAVAFSVGTRTLGSDIPTTGTANYNGFMLGNAFEGASQYSVNANAAALADFGARSVNYSTQGSAKTDLRTGAISQAANYDMSGTLRYAAGVNALSGTVTTADGKTGTATGAFYGPQASELGTTFKLTSPTGTLVGGAALKR